MTRRRDRTYRGTFATADGAHVGLDFYAENLSFAREHAAAVAAHDAMHVEVGPLTLVSVRPVDWNDFRTGDAGSWFPLTEVSA